MMLQEPGTQDTGDTPGKNEDNPVFNTRIVLIQSVIFDL